MNAGSTEFDVAIIGAGPAGMSAAVWCRELGLSAGVFEKETQAGGQLLSIYNPISNYIGLSARDGRELCARFGKDIIAADIPMFLASEVIEVEPGPRPLVVLQDGRRLSFRALILATGVRRRRLGVPGESAFVGKGILVSGARDRESVKGKTAVIVGGGDAALENALILSEHASKVYVIHRGDGFRGREEFVRAAGGRPNVEFVLKSTVSSINGDENVCAVSVASSGKAEIREIPAEAVLIRIGVEPNSELYKDRADVDTAGYVLVDQVGRTSAADLYAIGDVANPVSPTIATAVGSGASAAKAIIKALGRH